MKRFLFTTAFALSPGAFGACFEATAPQGDLLAGLLREAPECPRTVGELKVLLGRDGLRELPAFVANRGHHNPGRGSFSIFESVAGRSARLGTEVRPEHLYFGHFTALAPGKVVALDQENAPGKLLIEVIAYDFQKGIYNFYELVGTNAGPRWFYRGDSRDALEDNEFLKLGSAPQFGTRMRCSACHNSGGPIMKELAPPHNDWWTKARKLPLGGNRPSAELAAYFDRFIDAADFARNVRAGIELLEQKRLPGQRSLREQLRPLFCTTEINLVSDGAPLAGPASVVSIPTSVFVDPLLGGDLRIEVPKALYVSALRRLGSRFPETTLVDADHAFLAPVRSEVNQREVLNLIRDRIIDEEFAFDVLSIDFRNPLFSRARCELLKLVPAGAFSTSAFLGNLRKVDLPAARELADKLQRSDLAEHRARARAHLETLSRKLSSAGGIRDQLRALDRLRRSVFGDEISRNPRGQILEPGFRVIFAEISGPTEAALR
jgi:hypothetical protein